MMKIMSFQVSVICHNCGETHSQDLLLFLGLEDEGSKFDLKCWRQCLVKRGWTWDEYEDCWFCPSCSLSSSESSYGEPEEISPPPEHCVEPLKASVDALIADAKTNPNKIYLWAPMSRPGDTFRPEVKLADFFGGPVHVQDTVGNCYFEAVSNSIDIIREFKWNAKWSINTDRYHAEYDLILRDVFGVIDRVAWEAKGGGFVKTYFNPNINLEKLCYDNIRNDSWTWSNDCGKGEGRYYYDAMWFTLLPSAQNQKEPLSTIDKRCQECNR